MKEKHLPLIILFISSLSIEIFSQGIWTQVASIPFTPRYAAVGFAIGGKGYVGTGYDGNINYGDFWEFDPTANTWTQRASIPARRAASAFAIGNYGYVCMGVDPSSNYYTDIWEFNPTTNTWSQKANFPGTPRYGAAGFSIGTKGYVGCGNLGSASGPFTNEFWEFDPTANSWTQKTNFPGTARYGLTHMGWAVGNKGILGMGYNSTWPTDMYEYDQANNSWTQKANFPGNGRSYAVAFSNCFKYYAGMGQNNGTAMSDIWEYDPSTDTWAQKANFGGGVRWLMTSFVVAGYGYIGTGYDFNNNYADWWRYRCDTQGIFENENETASSSTIYPTVFSNFTTLEINPEVNINKCSLNVFDLNGRIIRTEEITANTSKIYREELLPGLYIYELVNCEKKIGFGKFIVN